MKIAFDAKRAYQNGTGLGHYSRTLIQSLAQFHPEHRYYLCAPKLTKRFDITPFPHVENMLPNSFPANAFTAVWRSKWVTHDLVKKGIDIYHGLSHEVPIGIDATNIKSVVTIHDLIFERYPEQYNKVDIQIYRKKFRYACLHADRIIAISKQTKADIIQFYQIPEQKIDICYQSCNPAFGIQLTEAEKAAIKIKYQLPDQYFLYVGSIIERKKLLTICKAIHLLKQQQGYVIPLVAIGDGGKYKQQVEAYIQEKGLTNDIILMNNTPAASSVGYRSAADFPAIYQQALGMIYPSVFEGFGIPVLEALWSKIPVITSNVSCMPETGGDAAYYVTPDNEVEIAEGMRLIAKDNVLREEMIDRGWKHAQHFTPQLCADAVMKVYEKL
jgi:glycosyltransferase involved in cell wall biosynthesis